MASTSAEPSPKFPWKTVGSNILLSGLAQGAGYGLAGAATYVLGRHTNLAQKLSPRARATLLSGLRAATLTLPPVLISARDVAAQQRIIDAREAEIARWRSGQEQASRSKMALLFSEEWL